MNEKKDIKIKCLVVVFLSLLLGFMSASCQFNGFATATPKLTATPDFPVPSLVSDFVEGYSAIPTGKHLFLEVWEDHVNIGDCIGPQAVPPIYHYRYENGVLSLNPSNTEVSIKNLENRLGIIGYSATSRYENPKDSWCTKNCGDMQTDLYWINSLPYMLTISGFPKVTIHSIKSNGELIVEIEQSVYLIEPGKSWYKLVDTTSEVDSTSQTTCPRYVSTYRLTNQGFVDVNDIVWQK